jgi:DNA (cytosine-5)-methyltransferase 1
MKLISLFSGIGGFELPAEWMGWQPVLSCEINPFSRKVLEYYWPDAYHHDDIHTLNIDKINEELSKRYGVNWADDDLILTGGFPCQPYSTAGKRLGKADERHLFPEMLRIIREVRPRYIVGENVRGLVSWSGGLVFEEVCADLEAEGYEVQPFILPACGVNAPHRRERVWFIANANERTEKSPREGGQAKSNGRKNNDEPSGGGEQTEQHFGRGNVLRLDSNPNGGRQPGKEHREEEARRVAKKSVPDDWENFPTQSPICGGDDGLPSELVGITFPKWRNESIKAYGNAIVPQVALEIFKAIEALR